MLNFKTPIALFWFRRDLRLSDNAGLYYALKEHENVLPLFIFDIDILNQLEDKCDARVEFIYKQIENLQTELKYIGSSILVKLGKPIEIFKELVKQYNITQVFTNHDYEPYAIKRDIEVANFLNTVNTSFKTYKDQVIFEKNEVLKDDHKPYTVFTPYMRKWKSKLNSFYTKPYPTQNYFQHFYKFETFSLPPLEEIGFKYSNISFPSLSIDDEIIKKYTLQRDIPSINGTSRISLHLRFGTVSIRCLVEKAKLLNETWLNELIWREFYMMILYHFPYVVGNSFKPAYDHIPWLNNELHFKLWCEGKTGYPIVDAGMRELNQTGFMHNRVRMITASFLTKHLLIDWRWGEAYFAKKLLDFELSSNNGGWQWSASCGCDAAPYFRVFNPHEQTKKFDPQLKYIKRWIPEYDELKYLTPIVDHKFARERVLNTYKMALSGVNN
ncbi:MAG TPA: deoxyribodipyrimidine photo-lyase [Bacteroidia bacterium]|nr:deoxyribodipyrimidine photo-lyase [Bacteroidia bacterium]